jgi:hypothetical protein
MATLSFSNPSNQGGAYFAEYFRVDWAETTGLTIGAALNWLMMMAYAPQCLTNIRAEYDPLDRWVEVDGGGYLNNTSGHVTKKLKKGQIELIRWQAAADAQGHKDFHAGKKTTYVQQLSDSQGRFYYFNHHDSSTAWIEPQGKVSITPSPVYY